MIKQPKHFFSLESNKNKSGTQRIFFHFSYGYKIYNPKNDKVKYSPVKISTKYSIKPEFWDKENFRTTSTYVRKYGKDLNNTLDKIEKVAYDQLSLYRNEYDENPNPNELKDRILEKLGRKEKINNIVGISDFIELQTKRRGNLSKTSTEHWSSGTVNQYQGVANKIKEYEERKNTKLTFLDITEEQLNDYFRTINEIQKEKTGKFYKQNTVAKEFKHLRTIFNIAVENNIDIGINISKKSLKISSSTSSSETYLSEEQLKKVIETDVSHSREFQHARNYIIISSLTGLRIGDMKYLHEVAPENIINNSQKYFCFTTKIRKNKDNNNELLVTIPVLKPVKDLLKDNKGKFPNFPSEKVLREDIEKFLKHLKFNDEVEIKNKYYGVDKWELDKKPQYEVFSPHDCRRTFITNLRQMGIQPDTIENITHPKLKSKDMIGTYDKSTLNDRAVKFIKEINSKISEIYKY